jgi:hypothetical protein
MLWNFKSFSKEKYLAEYCETYGEEAAKAKAFVTAFFDNMPSLDTSYLQYVHANYFNYNYTESVPGVKNFILKDGLILARGAGMAYHFNEDLPMPELLSNMHTELKRVIPIYEKLANDVEAWSKRLNDRLRRHVECKWWLYAKTLLHISMASSPETLIIPIPPVFWGVEIAAMVCDIFIPLYPQIIY